MRFEVPEVDKLRILNSLRAHIGVDSLHIGEDFRTST